MPKEVMQILQKTHVCSKPLNIESVAKPQRSLGKSATDSAIDSATSAAPKKEGFKKEGFKKEGFNKESFKKESFKKPIASKDEFKKDEFKKPAFSKAADAKSNPGKVEFSKPNFRGAESKDITREVLDTFPDLEAPGAKAERPSGKLSLSGGAAKGAKLKKAKSKRVDKDKGKRRGPSGKTPAE